MIVKLFRAKCLADVAFVTRETRAINPTKLLCLYKILGHNQALEKNRKQAQISSFTPSALQEQK